MTSKAKILIFFFLLTGVHPQLLSQSGYSEKFQLQFDRAGQLIEQTCDSLKTLITGMNLNDSLTGIQQAKINLIRSKIQIMDDIISFSLPLEVIPSDSILNLNPLMKKAQDLIVQSRPDEGIPLIMEYLKDVDRQSDSAVYARIYLAEAYREKREYIKGINIIYEILLNQNISIKNKAFALNRIAALYNEMPGFQGNKSDSVMKYSRLCINLSMKFNLTEYLAASQNEMGSVYIKYNIPDSALYFISMAAQNFFQLKKYPQTINTYLNLSRIYSEMGQLEESKDILLKALELGNIEENRNLFKYVYYYLADRSFKLGDYVSAYEYLQVAYSLQSHFYNDRINQQINEMSAKYDLQEKEAKIKEEAQRSRTYRLQINYLVVIALISIILLMILVVLFRFKSMAYTRLVKQYQKSMKLEKQVQQNLINLSENDIRIKIDPNDRNSELALRFEKFLAEEKPYLWSEVSLDEFCKKLNTNRTYLSKLINDNYNMSFYDLLFEYRIRAALEYLNNPCFKHLSVEGIGELSGFKSISNFYKRFKSVVGMTPNQFRERALKSESNPAS